jgi:hypothetical protein
MKNRLNLQVLFIKKKDDYSGGKDRNLQNPAGHEREERPSDDSVFIEGDDTRPSHILWNSG